MRTFAAALALLVSASAAWAGDLIPTDRRFGPLRVASHKVEVTVEGLQACQAMFGVDAA